MTTCTGACAAEWPPLTLSAGTTEVKAGPGVTASLLGTVTRPGGAVQVIFNGCLCTVSQVTPCQVRPRTDHAGTQQ
jgi:hypothetical protein